jgi:hypothetical protein
MLVRWEVIRMASYGDVKDLPYNPRDALVTEDLSYCCTLGTINFKYLMLVSSKQQTTFAPALPPPTIILPGSIPRAVEFSLHYFCEQHRVQLLCRTHK